MQTLREFVETNSLRSDIATKHPAIFEQVTRSIFYRGSTFSERLKLITDHLSFCENHFTHAALQQIYLKNGIILWNGDYHGESISLELYLRHTHYREGMMAFTFKIGNRVVYTITFWIERNKQGEPILKVGAFQGTREGLAIYRELTKYFFGYRPKNLVLLGLRTIAAQLAIKHMYAVSDYGFYTNNHIRLNKKLKTSLDIFWSEAGGNIVEDPRFFEIPITEPRKSIDEIVSHKRNLYRKRYVLLNEISAEITKSLELYMNSNKSLKNA